MKARIVCLACLLGLFLPGAVSGQKEKGNEGSIDRLDEVVVTATRQEENISSVPANISMITEQEIENSPARNVPDLLRTEAGVHVNDVTGNKRSYTVDLRGFGETAGSNTLVLVDGRKINQADLSGTDWTLIPLERIERIEIIRGGRGSVLYGDNAAGGIINIITKEGKAFRAKAGAAGGSYDTWKANAQASGSQKGLSYSLSGSYLTSDGYRDNSGTRAKDIGVNLGYMAGNNVRLNFSTGYHEDKTGLPGGLTEDDFESGASRTDTYSPKDFSEIEDYYAKASPELYFLNDSMLKIDMSYRNRESLFYYHLTSEGLTEIETISVSPRVVLREKVYGFDNKLTLGADFIEDQEDIANTAFYLGPPSTSEFELKKKNYGIYVHDEFNATENISISAGYRYDRSRFEFEPVEEDEVTMSEDLYTAGINYNFLKNSKVYASYARSFRNPLLDEFFNFQTNTVNPDLEAQTSDDYELGVRHYFLQNFYGDINLFRIDTENEVFFNPITSSNENFDGETRRKGIELSLTKEFEQVHLKGKYAYTDATIRGGEFDGNDFPGVPEHKASISSTFYPVKNLSVALNGIYVGERPFISDFENDLSEQEDYFVANTKIKYNWNKLSAYLNVNNLFNEEYSEYGVDWGQKSYYPSPKINFLIGFSMEL